ncbi:hypothetical protein AB0L06_27800 [Spirillospora sp. NPDC052269]
MTYNLTVGGLHAYYVLAGNTPVLVHNCDIGTLHSGKSLANNRAGMNVHARTALVGCMIRNLAASTCR